MKKFICITTVLSVLLTLTSYQVAASSFRPSQFSTRYEFYDSVIEARRDFEKASVSNTVNGVATVSETRDRLEEIVSYFDFNNVVNEVGLNLIVVRAGDVVLEYSIKLGEQAYILRIVRYSDRDSEKFMDSARTRLTSNHIELNYNGNIIIKDEVYHWERGHTGNQYFWIENGTAVQVNVSPALLELYPEETFFDLKEVTVSLSNLPPRVRLNGETLNFDTPPIIENGRTLVPLRTIFEALGADVEWEDNTQTVTAVKDETTVSMQIGSNELVKNGESITLDVPAQLVNGRTLVPARVIAESFGAKVEWDEEKQTVIIQTNEVSKQVSALSRLWNGVLDFLGLA